MRSAVYGSGLAGRRHTAASWYDVQISTHARILLSTAAALPALDRPVAMEELRRALVVGGEVDLTWATAMAS